MPEKIHRAFVFAIVACAFVLAGCSSHETQQQKFVDAMSHGNSAQASQIWLHMDAKSRADFSHSEGMQPNASPDDVKKQVMQHYQDEMGKQDDTGKQNENGETIEQPTPNVHLGGLESLPEWVGPTGAPPQSVTVPPTTTPSN
jgi:outer membrane murein-binding lipoprotein Lpp